MKIVIRVLSAGILCLVLCLAPLAAMTPAAQAAPDASGCAATYRVRSGDTLSGIAFRYHVSVWSIAAANHLTNPGLIYAGQWLCIPSGSPPPPPYCGVYYTVHAGDTLSNIASRYHVNVWTLAYANHLSNINYITIGQRLYIPCGGPPPPAVCPAYYVVHAGDTLSMIASRYHVSVWTLAQVNHLPNANYIYVGQRLWIPC